MCSMRKWFTRSIIRSLHVAVCLGIMLPLLLRPSALHRMIFNQDDLIHGVLYLIFFNAALVTYFIAGFTDPGYLTVDKARLFRHRRGHSSVCGDDRQSMNLTPSPADPIRFTSQKSHSSHYFTRLPNVSLLVHAFIHPFPWWCRDKPSADATFQDPPIYNVSVPVRFCKHCLLEQPLRCRHCPDCGRCVMKFDHHCPWIANCVGERNHASFVTFLGLQTLVLWWTFYLAADSVIPRHAWSDWFRVNGLMFSELFILAVIGIPLTALLLFHVYLALGSRTTWETVSYERIAYLKHLEDRVNPFNQGCAKNCYSFCCSRFPFGWDRIYAETLERRGTVSDPSSRSNSIAPIHPPKTSFVEPTAAVSVLTFNDASHAV